MVPIAQFYLGTTPNVPLNSAPFQRPQSMSQVNLQRSPTKETSGNSPTSAPSNRASMPPQRKTQVEASASTFLNQSPAKGGPGEPTVPEEVDEAEAGSATTDKGKQKEEAKSPTSGNEKHTRNGTMDKNFKFPPDASKSTEEPPPVPPLPESLANARPTETIEESEPAEGEEEEDEEDGEGEEEEANTKSKTSLSSSARMEVPPPDPVEKEKERVDLEGDDDIGATEEISLN